MGHCDARATHAGAFSDAVADPAREEAQCQGVRGSHLHDFALPAFEMMQMAGRLQRPGGHTQLFPGGGAALCDLCVARTEPIPFFGELGSINPVFLLPQALHARAEALAKGWASSLAMGAGQFCTNPGLVIVPESEAAEVFIATVTAMLGSTSEQVMLTDGIAEAYRSGVKQINHHAQSCLNLQAEGRKAYPALFRCTLRDD